MSFHSLFFNSFFFFLPQFSVAPLHASIAATVSVRLDVSQWLLYTVGENGERMASRGGGATAEELISPRLVCRSRLCCLYYGFLVKSDIKLISMFPAEVQVQAAPSAAWTMSGDSACDWSCTHKQTPCTPKDIFRHTHARAHTWTRAQKDNSRSAIQNLQGRLSNYSSWLFVFVCGLTYDALGY